MGAGAALGKCRRRAITKEKNEKEEWERKNGAPEEIRTPDPQIRSLVLYPAELRARFHEGSGPVGPVHPIKGRKTSRKSALATGFRARLQGPDGGKIGLRHAGQRGGEEAKSRSNHCGIPGSMLRIAPE